jgi:hypothetical protein
MRSGGTTIRRARLQDLTLPRLTVQEQVSLSESLQALVRRRRLAVEVIEAVDDLTQQVVDGLATGALRVPPPPASTDGGPP